MSEPTITARYADAETTVDGVNTMSRTDMSASYDTTSSNIIPMRSYTSVEPAAVPPVLVVPPVVVPAPPPPPTTTLAATPQLKYDDPVERRRLRAWYLLSGIFLLINAVVIAAVGGAVDTPYYRAVTAFSSYDPNTRRFRFVNLDYRGNMLIVPYVSIFVGIAGIGFILAGIFASRIQRSLAANRQNYFRAITIIIACTWETLLLGFAIGVSEIFLMLALAGLTTGMFGFWMIMDTVNRPGSPRLDFWSHAFGWFLWAYIFTILFAYAWADVNRSMPAILYVALFFLLGHYTIVGLIQFIQYLNYSVLVSPYRLDKTYIIVHVIFILVVAWLLFSAFIGLDSLN